jgi:hypothetical protein
MHRIVGPEPRELVVRLAMGERGRRQQVHVDAGTLSGDHIDEQGCGPSGLRRRQFEVDGVVIGKKVSVS